MGKAATLATLIFAVGVIRAISACSPFSGASEFHCSVAAECSQMQGTQGFCDDGLCSFDDPSCTITGHRYGDLAGSQSGQCVGGTPPSEAGVDTPVLPDVDMNDICFGTMGGLERPCWAPGTVPTGTVALVADIDTTNSSLCSANVKNSLSCVVAGDAITLAAGTTIHVTGSKPLVLVSTTGAITISGSLDVASHLGAGTGAGSNPATCNAGTGPNTSGGGAGGSFITLGGDGGDGVGAANSGGTPGAVVGAVTALHGGCNGQDGKEGTNGAASRGLKGAGGGVLDLIGKVSVTVAGTGAINASGAGATGGVNGSAGGGGGGSGGMIVIDTPTLTNGGAIFATGGGGGAGSGSAGTGPNGTDPTAAAAGVGGVGGTGAPGGNGGSAAAGAAGGNSGTRGGGGAGGSTGLIRLFGGAATNGTISPAAT